MNPDLKRRIPTAIIYVLVIAGCFLTGDIPAMILLWLFYAFCLYEFIVMSRGPKWTTTALVSLIMGHLILSLSLLDVYSEQTALYLTIFSLTVFAIEMFSIIQKTRSLFSTSHTFLASLFYLTIPFFIALSMVFRVEGFRLLLLGLFIMIWLNDAGAYFVGKAIGKRKLYPAISPGKSWEGMFGGGVLTVITAVILSKYIGHFTLTQWIITGVIIWISAVMGDLTESALKRSYGIKDTGSVLRGHGGFLDRLDSFIFSIPFLAGLFLLFN